jgi:hypothetical protein
MTVYRPFSWMVFCSRLDCAVFVPFYQPRSAAICHYLPSAKKPRNPVNKPNHSVSEQFSETKTSTVWKLLQADS